MSTTDLPPVTLLQQEIQSITSSMRRNQRWASSSAQQFAASQPPLPPYLQANKKRRSAGGNGLVPAPRPRRSKGGEQVGEGDLMGGFIELRRLLGDCRDITQVAPLEAVAPFLALIRSPLTSGPITSLSLTSLHAIILNILPLHLSTPPRYVAPSTPLQIGLAHITSTLSSCRFPSSSPQQDELVLLRLLRVIEALATPIQYPASPNDTGSKSTSPGIGSLLDHMGDESVCELLEVGLGMLARARLSEGLRSTAQSCVQTIVRAAFRRLKTLTPDDVEKLLAAAKDAETERDKKDKALAQAQSRNSSPKAEKRVLQDGDAEEIKDEQVEDKQERKSAEGSADAASAKAVERASIDTGASMTASTVDQDLTPPPFTPYGLPTILELLRVLVALLNPSDQAHTDSMRYAALAVLNTALEVGGNGLGTWPELREGVRDEGCKYLFQLTRSDSSPLLAQSLRTTSTLFSTMLPHLKLQLELFLSYLIDRLTPPPSAPVPAHLQNLGSRPGTPVPGGGGYPNGVAETDALLPGSGSLVSEAATPTASTPRPMQNLPPVPNETRELMLETLTQLAQRPGFMVDCWVNYDCSTDSEDIFERLIAFLSRGVYPVGPPKQDGSSNLFDGLDAAQLSSLEVLLSYIGAMADRLEFGSDSWPSSSSSSPASASSSIPSADSLKTRKERKGILIQGASMFNAKPKNGLAFLEKEGIIAYETEGLDKEQADEKRAVAVAAFLRSSSRLDKKEIGDYISRPDQVPLLKAFMRTFDFKGKTIADAMRELLETFRLPGEAQPIARITEVFAEVFFASGPPEIASQDAVYVLAYSVIMLNTDLHNPQNRKRMTVDDYKRNVRGVNDGKDFDPDYLAAIHESLKKKEIILPEEHSGSAGFEYAWKSLVQRTRTAGTMISCNTSLFDEAMFQRSWRPLIASIAYAFTMSAQDEHVIQKAITGFRQCATLAGHFGLPEVFDTIVLSLSTATGLLDNIADSDPATANFPVVDKDNQSLTISPLSVQFGQSYRSQLATVVLFAIAKSHAGAVRQGWLQIFEMFQTLFLHGLLPMPMLQMEDFLAGQTTIPMKTASPADRRGDAAAGGGLLSTLSSYLLSPYGASAENVAQMEVEEEDVESTLVAVDCLASCKLEELYGEVLNLPPAALVPALTAIRQLAESRSTARLAHRKGSLERSETGSPRRMNFEGQLPYDPACVFHLEMMVSLASRQKDNITETWPIIFEYIASLLNSAQHYSVLLTERAVVGLLRLCLIVSETPSLRDQLYIALDILRSLPSSVLANVSEQLMAGIAKILEKDSSVVRSQTEWGLIIALFRATANHPEASKVTLAIVQKMVNEQSGPELTVDNWKGVVDLLDEFGTAAGWANAATGVRRPGGLGQHQQQQLQGSRQSGAGKQRLAPVVERGLAALESLYELQHFVPRLAKDIQPSETWHALWFPVLSIMSKHTVNPVREIRQRAISYLQRILLSPSLLGADQATLPLVFDKILFPIMDEVLKPASMERDPGGFGETRTKAATAMCKVFLQYHVNLTHEQVGVLFGRLLDRMERFMKGERDMLNEAGESLKNLVLIMHSSSLLVPPSAGGKAEDDQRTPEQKKLWAESAVKIERVLPGFLSENLAPPPALAPGRKSAEAASAQAAAA